MHKDEINAINVDYWLETPYRISVGRILLSLAGLAGQNNIKYFLDDGTMVNVNLIYSGHAISLALSIS